MKRLAAVLAASLVCALASAAEIDKEALYKHIRKAFSIPPQVELELKDLKPSGMPGFQEGLLESRYQGRSQSQPLQISQDGRYYVLSGVYSLEPSKVPGLLSAKEEDAGVAGRVYFSPDAKRFVIGQPYDMTVDPDAPNRAKLRVSGVRGARGSKNASVALVEFSDLECPYCRGAHLALEKDLVKAYGGKVRWIFKQFPLVTIHPWAYRAAIADACATKLKADAGWRVAQYFFENQPSINPGNVDAKAAEAAKSAGLDAGNFKSCYDKQGSKPQVDADVQEANSLGVDSTPTFFVNGHKVSGFMSFEAFKPYIDTALADASGK